MVRRPALRSAVLAAAFCTACVSHHLDGAVRPAPLAVSPADLEAAQVTAIASYLTTLQGLSKADTFCVLLSGRPPSPSTTLVSPETDCTLKPYEPDRCDRPLIKAGPPIWDAAMRLSLRVIENPSTNQQRGCTVRLVRSANRWSVAEILDCFIE